MKTFQVYKLTSSENPDEVKYIGQTCKKLNVRFRQHKCESRDGSNRRSIWFKSVLESGHTVIITPIEEGITSESQSLERERFYINHFIEQGFQLVNTPQEEINEIISSVKKGIPNLKATGVPLTEEHKQKISLKHKGKKLSPDHVKQMTEYRTGRLLGETTSYKRAVIGITSDGVATHYPSAYIAARETNTHQGSISSCCNGRNGRVRANGIIWKFAEEQEHKAA